MKALAWILLGIVALLALALLLDTDEAPVRGSISVAEALQGDTTGYRPASR